MIACPRPSRADLIRALHKPLHAYMPVCSQPPWESSQRTSAHMSGPWHLWLLPVHCMPTACPGPPMHAFDPTQALSSNAAIDMSRHAGAALDGGVASASSHTLTVLRRVFARPSAAKRLFGRLDSGLSSRTGRHVPLDQDPAQVCSRTACLLARQHPAEPGQHVQRHQKLAAVAHLLHALHCKRPTESPCNLHSDVAREIMCCI